MTHHILQAKAYAAIDTIKFEGAQYRTDIAYQAIDHAEEPAGMTYADAGVDIAAGDSLVARIKPVCKATKRTGCDAAIGGFGGVSDDIVCSFFCFFLFLVFNFVPVGRSLP